MTTLIFGFVRHKQGKLFQQKTQEVAPDNVMQGRTNRNSLLSNGNSDNSDSVSVSDSDLGSFFDPPIENYGTQSYYDDIRKVESVIVRSNSYGKRGERLAEQPTEEEEEETDEGMWDRLSPAPDSGLLIVKDRSFHTSENSSNNDGCIGYGMLNRSEVSSGTAKSRGTYLNLLGEEEPSVYRDYNNKRKERFESGGLEYDNPS